MVDYALGFIADNVWILCFLAAALYNIYTRPDYKPMIYLSSVLAVAYSLTKIAYSQFVLPSESLLDIYYLYWGGATIFIAALIIVGHQIKGFSFQWPAKLAVSILLFEFLLHVAVHVDRDIMALNGASTPNAGLSDAWWLWSFRNSVLVIDNFIILASLVFPYKAFKSRDDIYTSEFSSIQMDRAFKRIELLEDVVYTMPAGLKKTHAYQCVESARFLLEQWDSQGEDRRHLYSANTLCDRARYLAFTSDDVAMEKLEELNGVPKVDYR